MGKTAATAKDCSINVYKMMIISSYSCMKLEVVLFLFHFPVLKLVLPDAYLVISYT